MKPKVPQTFFKHKLSEYKKLIDDDIENYSNGIKYSTLLQYGVNTQIETDVFFNTLSRGGKRIRGALTILGYEMSGGKNTKMIVQVARAIEMIHAYILIIDDIQDRSPMRRGDKSAHKKLSEYHSENELAGNSDHFGMSIAINSALSGMHAAQMILASVDIAEDLRLKIISILNRTMAITVHGQTNDIFNEVSDEVSEEDLNRVLKWKTAYYTLLNPLHVGMVLAGADCHVTDAITDYAVNTGIAFQITDDIISVFSEENHTGKNPMDDIKEGKKTILSVYALHHTSSADKNFLIRMLGNTNLKLAEFIRVKDILIASGALKNAQQLADEYIKLALESLHREEKSRWTKEGVEFLIGFAKYIQTRTE